MAFIDLKTSEEIKTVKFTLTNKYDSSNWPYKAVGVTYNSHIDGFVTNIFGWAGSTGSYSDYDYRITKISELQRQFEIDLIPGTFIHLHNYFRPYDNDDDIKWYINNLLFGTGKNLKIKVPDKNFTIFADGTSYTSNDKKIKITMDDALEKEVGYFVTPYWENSNRPHN